ncbi:MAG: hypothetical protein ACW99Q_18155, partial [Candidatus Kariarchaeaceae archaeon]
DKRPIDEKGIGLAVPGIIRILVEIGSAALGLFAAFEFFSIPGLLFQLSITIISFYLDFERWLWMIGKNEIPNYVTYVYKKN